MRIYIILPLLFFIYSANAHALQAFKGQIQQKWPKLEIKLTTGDIHCLTTDVPSLEDDVSRLKNGDFLQFRGHFQGKCINLIYFEHILVFDLLGLWQSQNMLFFNFSSDNRLSIQNPFYVPALNENFSFTVYPGQGPFWSIIISNNQQSRIGLIQVMLGKSYLRFVNSTDPASDEHYELRRID